MASWERAALASVALKAGQRGPRMTREQESEGRDPGRPAGGPCPSARHRVLFHCSAHWEDVFLESPEPSALIPWPDVMWLHGCHRGEMAHVAISVRCSVLVSRPLSPVA